MKKILIKLSVLAVIAGAGQFSTASAFINHPDATALQATPNRLQQGCQGGAFDCTFAVQPVFTFTRIDDAKEARVLDAGSKFHPDFEPPADVRPNMTPDELDIDFNIPPPEEVLDEEIAWLRSQPEPTPGQKGPLDDTTVGDLIREKGLLPKKPPPPPLTPLEEEQERERKRQRMQEMESVLEGGKRD